jgi:hypothetical protein
MVIIFITKSEIPKTVLDTGGFQNVFSGSQAASLECSYAKKYYSLKKYENSECKVFRLAY